MNRDAVTAHPIQSTLVARWSPYCFSDRPVATADLQSLFEAARWAASSFNEQPWRFLVAQRKDADAFAAALSCLAEANQAWAKHAPVLVLTVISTRFSHNGKPNRVALHDLGLAAAGLTVEATARGLCVHQMAGILPERVREVYGVPEGYEPQTAIAIGYASDGAGLPEELRQRDQIERTRKPLGAIVFEGTWENASTLA